MRKLYVGANIGHLSNKKLKERLEKIEAFVKIKDKKMKKIRNGKVGINKHININKLLDKYILNVAVLITLLLTVKLCQIW